MDGYKFLAFSMGLFLFVYAFDLGVPIRNILENIANISLFEDKGPKPWLVDLATLMVMGIVVVAIVKLVTKPSNRDDD